VDDESNILDGIQRMLRVDRAQWDMHFAVGGEAPQEDSFKSS
jgi:hypothetical protein